MKETIVINLALFCNQIIILMMLLRAVEELFLVTVTVVEVPLSVQVILLEDFWAFKFFFLELGNINQYKVKIKT